MRSDTDVGNSEPPGVISELWRVTSGKTSAGLTGALAALGDKDTGNTLINGAFQLMGGGDRLVANLGDDATEGTVMNDAAKLSAGKNSLEAIP